MKIGLQLQCGEIAARRALSALSFCSRGTVALVVVIISLALPRTAFALTLATHPATMDNPSPGWDPWDPENQVDARSFVEAHWDALWHAESTGAWPLSESEVRSQFRNTLPGDFGIVYHRWECVFRKIYAHRLSNMNEEAYDLWDLMRDDESIRDDFKEFVLAGKIAPSITNCEAFYSHYLMLIEAASGLGAVQVTGMRINEEGAIESLDMSLGDADSISLETTSEASAAVPAEIELSAANQRKLCDVIWWSRASVLACMTGEGLWQADTAPDWFDCDDFMLAMRNWLRRKMGQDIVRPFLFRWRCPGEAEFRGHWMPVVIIGGKYYLIDPYTGTVFGPYQSSKEGRKEMAKQGILTVEAVCRDAFGNQVEPEWDEQPRFFTAPNDVPPKAREPRPPFWRNPDSLARFCARLALCCGRLPSASEQTSPACGAPPDGADDDSIAMDPCDGSNYLPEPLPSVTWPIDPNCRNLPPN